MLAKLFNRAPKVAPKVNIQPAGIDLDVEGKKTILQTALEQGVAFPHNCRVGGCGACKCKLVNGRVKELTDKSYLLSAEEIQSGYILACQSVPLTNVVIDAPNVVAEGEAVPVKKVSGKIAGLKNLNHDIIELTIALDDTVEYKAGQYADVSVPGVIEEARSYSFAMANRGRPMKLARFHVRLVPGGEFTQWLHNEAAAGQSIELEAPFGDFYMRSSDAPILCVAGGSGMAPIKALLEQASHDELNRDVTYFFGARTQADLYALTDMEKIAAKWRARFEFIPVLSDEPEESDWQGLRGFVTEHISALGDRLEDHHVYMCGPPPMLDAAIDVCKQGRIAAKHIHFDKFLDKSSK